MQLVKIRLNKTFKDKEGKSHYYICYALKVNDKLIFIKPMYNNDYSKLDFASEGFIDYVK